ncbi:MAG: hypothetical protein KJ607_10690 [Bacteroidetes bacterium]|nr:hypothetical protein [Bacteroidota bacterium]
MAGCVFDGTMVEGYLTGLVLTEAGIIKKSVMPGQQVPVEPAPKVLKISNSQFINIAFGVITTGGGVELNAFALPINC